MSLLVGGTASDRWKTVCDCSCRPFTHDYGWDILAPRAREVSTRHDWTLPPELSFLPVGIHSAVGGAGAFLSPETRRILAVGHLLRGFPGSFGIHRGGDAAGCGFTAERLSGIRATVAHHSSGNGYFR